MAYLKLYVKDVGGQKAYIDIPYDDDGQGDGVLWSGEATVEGYIEITSPLDYIFLDAINLGEADLIAKRDSIKNSVIAFGGGNEDSGLDAVGVAGTVEDQKYLVKLLIGSDSKREEIYTTDGVIDYESLKAATGPYNIKAQECRAIRVDNVTVDGHTYLDLPKMMEILSDTAFIIDYYKNQGLKGEPYDPVPPGTPSLSAYVLGLAPFNGVDIVPTLGRPCVGLKDKAWTTRDGRNMEVYSQAWQDILFEGGVPWG